MAYKKISLYLKENKRLSITEIGWFMLFNETRAVYSDYHTKPKKYTL